ncbi:MAG: hypothetical protein IJY25_03125 [Bacilli bacterium]|nr:hypothetical protein [Bacilli bacterium]
MKTYYLSGDDVNKINRLLETAKAVEKLYNKLYILEINGQKETDEYKKQMEFLNISIDLENRLYKKYNFSIEKQSILIKYLVNFKYHKNYIDNEACIINQDYANIHVRRVINKLTNELSKTKAGIKEIYFEEVELMENDMKESINNIRVLKELQRDIFSSYLLFLQEYILNEQYKCYKNEFIKSKYNLSFVYEKIEKIMLNNNFDINKELYLGSKLVSDILKIDLQVYNYMKDDYSSSFLKDIVFEFIEFKDLDYNDKNKSVSAMLRMCYIRSCLLMVSEQKITDINCELQEYINSEEYLNKHINDTISQNLIKICFDSIEKDRTKVKRLSFGIK